MATKLTVPSQIVDEIDELVATGRFATRDAVVEEGIRRLRAEEAWLRMVDAKVAAGRADVAAGRVHSIAEVRDEMRARFGAPL